MNFNYSEEQQLIKDSVERFVRDQYDFETRQKNVASEEGFLRRNWATFAELGWLGMPLPEADGGFGGGGVETMIVMEGIGAGLVAEPYLSTVVLGGGILARHGDAAQRQEMLPKLVEGNLLLAAAFAEPRSRFALNNVTTTAKKDGDEYVIDGHKAVVSGGPSADRFIVSARTAGGQRDNEGISLFVVGGEASGLSRRNYGTQDGHRAADLTFESVRVPAEAAIGPIDGALPIIEEAADHAVAALAAEAVGAMQVAHDLTLEYSKTRKQFGQPIGRFQVLQHRMADMFIHLEEARSLAVLAALKLDGAADDRARTAAMAKVQAGRSGRFIGQSAIQTHGGMGMTEEMSVSHYFKRLTMIDVIFGNADWHLKRVAAMA